MRIKIRCAVGASRSFVPKDSKDGKAIVLVRLNFMGGAFQVTIPERLVPDQVEGKMVEADLELSSDGALKPKLRLLDWKILEEK